MTWFRLLLCVWSHYASSILALVFSLVTMLVAVPSAVKIFTWAPTLYKGSITFETLMPYGFRLHVLGIGYLTPMAYTTWSPKYGAIAGPNPWRATGLEWQIQSPPPTDRLLEIPFVDYEAYDYECLANKTRHEVRIVGQPGDRNPSGSGARGARIVS